MRMSWMKKALKASLENRTIEISAKIVNFAKIHRFGDFDNFDNAYDRKLQSNTMNRSRYNAEKESGTVIRMTRVPK